MQFAISKFSTRAIPLSGTGTIGTKYGMRFSKQICGNALKKSKDWFLDKKRKHYNSNSWKRYFKKKQIHLWKRFFPNASNEFVETSFSICLERIRGNDFETNVHLMCRNNFSKMHFYLWQ
jgi:hypothetical protein